MLNVAESFAFVCTCMLLSFYIIKFVHMLLPHSVSSLIQPARLMSELQSFEKV